MNALVWFFTMWRKIKTYIEWNASIDFETNGNPFVLWMLKLQTTFPTFLSKSWHQIDSHSKSNRLFIFFFIAIVWKTYPENQIIFCSNIVILHTLVVIKTAIEQWRRSIIWKSNNSISKTNLRMSIELASFFLPFW